jgi:signal transduction histidine kinase
MTMIEFWWIWPLLSVAAVSAAVLVIWRNHHRTRRTMEGLSQMLDAAMDGSFAEGAYDESLLSSVEAKLNHYLNTTVLSRRNLQAEKEKIESLIADISHQTKTPLANILLYTSLLNERKDLNGDCKGLAVQAAVQTEKLRFLVDALVKMSRLETGILTLVPEDNSVDTLLEEALTAAEPAAGTKGIAIRMERSGLTACFDPKWTQEALGNIIDNGIKNTPAGGSISISAAAYEFFCRIDIADTGIGIAEEEQPLIFQRFYRSPQVSREEGVGIGLYLARNIIEAQNGYISVASRAGGGSVFSVFLPRKS